MRQDGSWWDGTDKAEKMKRAGRTHLLREGEVADAVVHAVHLDHGVDDLRHLFDC